VELTKALESTLSKPHRKSATLLAGAALLALDIALDRWQSSKAKTSLKDCINDAFNELICVATIK